MIVELTDRNFDTEIYNFDGLTIVNFMAEWCGPCHMLSPMFEELAETYKNQIKVGKLDIDKHSGVAARFQISGIPTTVILKNGKVIYTKVGIAKKADLEKKIETHI
ncbi:thioredoxin [Chitinophaga sp. Cy-1792]|uniref:thioredoxin n=1 Tax=Chitinophaga sp. Cy-1792 TaxID=2608339 RepID=UPI001422AA69|nr:thioredoxin [Chitinophaga sp. Cy-1792]NIG55276.1 thioredoxin [Chitinophaga sp. Cy-1792]